MDPYGGYGTGPAPGWYRDPSGRFELRYWDGSAWSEHVATRGAMYSDPPRPTGPPAAPATPPVPPRETPPFTPATPAPAERPQLALATLGQRLGSFLLELLLMVVTLVVGWLVWSCVIFSNAQSPAKSILGQRVVRKDTGRAADWAEMFLRTIVLEFGIVALSVVLFGVPLLIAGSVIFAGNLRQTAWDRMSGTLVVLDREGVSLPRPGPWGY